MGARFPQSRASFMLVRRIGGDLKFGTSCVRGTLSFRCRAMISAPSTTSLPINRNSSSSAAPRPTTMWCLLAPGSSPTTRRASWGGLCNAKSLHGAVLLRPIHYRFNAPIRHEPHERDCDVQRDRDPWADECQGNRHDVPGYGQLAL